MQDGNGKLWTVNQNGEMFPCIGTRERMPAGVYTVQSSIGGLFFRPQPLSTDELYEYPEGTNGYNFLDEIEKFWSARNQYREIGVRHTRGFLMYGPPGTGKSGLLTLAIQRSIAAGRVGIQVEAGDSITMIANAITTLRSIEPNREITLVFEDIDQYLMAGRSGESELLALLDGQYSIDNAIVLATTNYPQLIPDRLIHRPRRFDRVFEVGLPCQAVREAYFKAKLRNSVELARELARNTEGFTFAAMTELVVETHGLAIDSVAAIENIRNASAAKFRVSNDDDDDYEFDASEMRQMKCWIRTIAKWVESQDIENPLLPPGE